MHCIEVEPLAQALSKRASGLSVTSLMRCIRFFASTPILSPPSLSLATPTDVQTCTIRCMANFLDDWTIDQPPPASWLNRTTNAIPPAHELIEVRKERVIMFDGDTGHLVLRADSNDLLDSMFTDWTGDGERSIRFRTRGNDAPELEMAFKLFPMQRQGSRSSTSFTVHSGVESLRFARRVIVSSSRIYFHVPLDASGRPLVLKDLYGRYLLDIWVDGGEGSRRALFLLPEILASGGHTMSFYADGIDSRVHEAMLTAKDRRIGMFRLPEETRSKPFRPWDVRKKVPPTNQDHIITSTPQFHHFRYQISPLLGEGLVYPGRSTLPGAGEGLFLRPRSKVVKSGDHLCVYAESWTPEQPGPEAG